MMPIVSRLSALFLLAGCAAAAPPQEQQEQQAAPASSSAAAGCASVQPWTRASKALNHPVVQSTGAGGKAVYTIKGVSYAEISTDHDLTGGVKLTDPRGNEPAPTTLYNIVWAPEDDSCTARYSAPTFFDVR